jgi:DNA-binding response OmpR family regulator
MSLWAKRIQQKETILLVDDDRTATVIRAAVLERNEYRVLKAYDAGDGLKIALEQTPDLVVADLFLRGSSGVKMAQKLKQSNPEVPVLLLSGAIEAPKELSGVDCFLSKAEGPEMLLKTIRQLLDSRVTHEKLAA